MLPAFSWECLPKNPLSLSSRLRTCFATAYKTHKTQSRGGRSEGPCRKRHGLRSHLMAPPAAAGSKSRSINLWTQSFRRPQGGIMAGEGRERGGNFVGRGGLPTSNGFHSPLQMQKRFQMGSKQAREGGRETLEMVLLFSLLTEESVTRRRTDVMGKSRSQMQRRAASGSRHIDARARLHRVCLPKFDGAWIKRCERANERARKRRRPFWRLISARRDPLPPPSKRGERASEEGLRAKAKGPISPYFLASKDAGRSWGAGLAGNDSPKR